MPKLLLLSSQACAFGISFSENTFSVFDDLVKSFIHKHLCFSEVSRCSCNIIIRVCSFQKSDDDFDFLPLTEDPFIALVSSDHPLTQKGFVTPEDLAREPFIMMHPEVDTDCSRYLEQNGIVLDIRFTCSDTLAAYHMVEAKLGITLDNSIYTSLFSGNVTALPLRPQCTIPIGIATPEASQQSPAAKRFIELSRAYFIE